MSDDSYVTTLCPASIKKAQEELNEDPENRAGAIQTLRQWLLKQEHLRFPTETRVLLMFLRHAKFSQLKVRSTIEKFCQAKQLHQDVFSNLDPSDEMFIQFIKTGIWLVLPGRSEDGAIRLINRAGAYNPAVWKTNKVAWFKSTYLFWQYISLSEENQVNGYRFLADFSEFTMAHQRFFTMDEMKWLLKRFQVVMEGRNLERVYQVFPMECLPEEYLPDDYKGPNAGTIDQITDRMLAEMQQAGIFRQLSVISDPRWGYDAALEPKDENKVQGSFRMLKW